MIATKFSYTHQDAFGGIGIFSENLENAYPGHCLLKHGTLLSASCTSNDTVLQVADWSRLAKRQAEVDRLQPYYEAYLLIYPLDGVGQPIWEQAEHVRITAVDSSAGTVTVQRGQLGSTARAFTAGQAVLARHMMFWSNQWQLNLSLECPRGGPFNMTAAEWYALSKKQRIWASGADGIEFDVARWQWGNPVVGPMDCDNDLVADQGYIGGVNSFGHGAQVMLARLRELLGPDQIIQMDGNDAIYGQRGWKHVNGVQLESFPHANHFERYSESFLHLRQWVENADPDGDGFTNRQEYIAGTLPLDPGSFFACTWSDGILEWNGTSNRLYDIHWSTNLPDGFKPLATGIEWPQSALTNAPAQPAGFYQLDVRRP